MINGFSINSYVYIFRYKIISGNDAGLFSVDADTGEVTVASSAGLNLDNIPTDLVTLTLEVTDGKSTDTAVVDVSVRDVNDRSPEFERSAYEVSVPENAAVGTQVE